LSRDFIPRRDLGVYESAPDAGTSFARTAGRESRDRELVPLDKFIVRQAASVASDYERIPGILGTRLRHVIIKTLARVNENARRREN